MHHLTTLPWSVKAYYLVLTCLAIFCLHRLFLVVLYYRKKGSFRSDPPLLQPLPPVTIQLPVYNEKYVVQRLIEASCSLDYPNELLEIQVLDDSTDETSDIIRQIVQHKKAAGIHIHHLQRQSRTGFKAGALAYGMGKAKGAFIAIFDADFIPPADFLTATIHQFSDPQVGMVQTRWDYVNRNYSLLTRIQALLLDGHFVIEHAARFLSGRFFNFNGTAGIWRREAIVDAGGWQHDTLTEDLDLSYRAQLRGWRFIFLNDVTVASELPVDINAFKTQQHRWAKGSVETLTKLAFPILTSKQPWKVKIEAIYHLSGNLAYVLVVLLALLMYPSVLGRFDLQWQLLLTLDLPLFFCSFLTVAIFFLAAQKESGNLQRTTVILLPLTMAMGVGLAINNAKAALEALVHHKTPFIRTPKLDVTGKKAVWRPGTYHCRMMAIPILELMMGFYFLHIMLVVAVMDKYLLLPFLLLFFVGFMMSAVFSFYHNAAAIIHGGRTA
ncbi:MAG: glycosyltransferase family 2 protein [Deltaproteobacteria bacterium]|nr:glycosyltransferase family 2 protein [Candidatus Anaeroferrophillus wilburensis]MBN2888595.1 glycosyltransferase family 2 protein [Deltaproteobacteria bacterium]